MKRVLPIIIASMIMPTLLAGLAGNAFAQRDEVDWSDDLRQILIYDHPEIIREVFYQYGMVPDHNAPAGIGYREVIGDGKDDPSTFDFVEGTCATKKTDDGWQWGYTHVVEMWFMSGVPPHPMTVMISEEDLRVEEIRSYQLEGLNVVIFIYKVSIYSSTLLPWANELRYEEGHIEFVPGSGEYFVWTIGEMCVGTYGETMPPLEDVLFTTLQVMKSYGFRTPEELSAAGEPTPTPFVYAAPIVPIDEEPGASPDDLEAVQATQMDPSLPPAMLGGVAVGALLGLLLGQGIVSLTAARPPVSPPAPVYYSPATGEPAPLAQVQQEQSMMDAGYVYRDGEWHAPKGEYRSETPAYATSQAEQARDQVRAEFERYTAERRARLKQERIKEYAEMAERHLQGTRESLDRALTGVTVAEIGIETTYDVGAALLIRRFPVKTIGRATWLVRAVGRKYLGPVITEAYSQVKIAAKNVVRWNDPNQETSFGKDQLLHLITKPLDLIPGGRFVNPARALAEEGAKAAGGNITQNIIDNSFFTGQ